MGVDLNSLAMNADVKSVKVVKEPISLVNPSSSPPPITLTQTMPHTREWNTKNFGWRLGADLTAATSAAVMVAPLITIIDKGIMENASGRNTLKSSIQSSLKNLVLRPHTLIFSKPFALICMLYGGTYLTANTLDTVTATVENKPSTLVTSGTLKFAASSSANISLCLFKDRVFVRMFGPSGPPRPVPFPSMALFALRDCLTIFASFNVPPLIGPILSQKMGDELNKTISGATVAQFLAPASIQIFSTPLHLLGLDLYNRNGKGVTWADRLTIVQKNWAASTVARMCRIIPAFGLGGVVNSKVRRGLLERMD